MKALRWSSVLCALTALGLGLVCSEAKPKKTAEPAPAQPKPTLQPTQPTSLWRTWSDAQSNRVEAELLSLDGEHVQVRTKQGQTYRLNLTKLVPEDRVFAEKAAKLLPGPQVPAETAAAKVDALVRAGLQKAGGAPNPALAEEQFVRRLYLDVTGRIPTAKEVYDYLRDTTPNKRARLIDTLLTSEGYASQMFNWLADMLRVADHYGKQVRSYVYQEWLKEQIAANRHWDTLVYEMLTAEGRISSSGPTGYLLRDRGMPLDNLSNTLTTFLGANVACAQCHDHPTASWTERNFYEMAAFFGATEQGFGKKQGLPKGLNTKFDKKQVLALLTPYQARVETLDKVTTTFPKDYKYDDAKPGSPVQPKLITWEKGDEQSPAYLGATPAEPSQLRERFATWMTHPDNPRFALTIANRLWKKLFGLGVQEPITDLDDLQQASNRELLLHLGEEMKRVHFDLREFQRILLNTSAYQAQASPSPDSDKGPYLFPGPLLRRMSGEQVWDSILSLVVGPELDQFKLKRADQIRRLDIPQATLTPAVIEAKLAELHQSGGKFRKKTGGEVGTGDFEGAAPPQFEGLTLARASELPQPSKESHFLRNFGQSDRQIADSNSTEGGVPQLLMMMNGPVQKAITSPASLVLRETSRVSPKEDQIRYLYLSFLGRFPSAPELLATKSMISNGLTIKDLTWVFLNTREFLFIQ